MLNLTRIDLATVEARQYHIDYWTSLFKATIWEELKMLAEENEFIANASSTVYQLSQEETIRLQCEAREDYYRRERRKQKRFDMLKEEYVSLKKKGTLLKKKRIPLKCKITLLENSSTRLLNYCILYRKANAATLCEPAYCSRPHP